MGFNISGIAMDQTFDKDPKKVAEALKLSFELVEETNFETASKNWTPEKDVYVYFSDQATLIFMSYEHCFGGFRVPGAKVLTFAYSATAMTFLMHYWDQNRTVRMLNEAEGDIVMQRGTPLSQESKGNGLSGLIFDMIEEVLGQSFYSIEMGEKAYHCQFN